LVPEKLCPGRATLLVLRNVTEENLLEHESGG
jgi:hypothetical protein